MVRVLYTTVPLLFVDGVNSTTYSSTEHRFTVRLTISRKTPSELHEGVSLRLEFINSIPLSNCFLFLVLLLGFGFDSVCTNNIVQDVSLRAFMSTSYYSYRLLRK